MSPWTRSWCPSVTWAVLSCWKKTDLDKMTHLLLTTLEYLMRIHGFLVVFGGLLPWLKNVCALAVQLFEHQPPCMPGSSTEHFPVFKLQPALFIRRAFTGGPGSLPTMIP